MSKFLSGRQSNLKLGVSGYTENQTVLQTTGKVGIGTTDAQQYSLYVVGDTNITDTLTVNGINITGPSTVTANVNYADDIVVSWGDSEDLKIYHDSAGQSYIRDTGTGDLNLTSDGSGIHLQSGGGETLARFYTDGPALLYYDGQQRLSTSGLGLTVTGAIDLNGNLDVAGVSTFTGLIDANGGIDAASAKVEDLTNDRIVLAGVGGELEDSPNLTFDGNTLNVVGYTELDNLNVSGIATINSLDVQTDFDVYDTTATFHNDLYVAGNLSIGGTTTVLQAQDLQIFDKDIILGVTTDSNGNDISTDITANHGGIAIASTEGNPLVPFFLAGVNEDIPDTYKQIMWVKSDSYGFGTTDAWLFNYAVGIGSTLVPNGVRLAVSEIQFTDDTVNTPNIDVGEHTELNTLNVSGVSTFNGTTEVKNSSFKVTNSIASGQYLEIIQNGDSSLNLNKVGVGAFFIEGNNIYLGDDDSSQTYAGFERNGKVYLNHNGITRLETTGYGVTIYNDLRVGAAVSIYGNAGIVSAISFYGDGSNLTNTGATLNATSGVERLVTTQLTSGTMVNAATDADLTFNAGNNTLNTENIKISGGISTDGSNYGINGQLLRSVSGGKWEWVTVPGIFSVNNILNGFNVLEEGATVGTAGSIHTLDFRGNNIVATADPQPNGIATITMSDTPTFDSLTVTGDLDVDGHTELDQLRVSGVSTFVGITTVESTLFTNQLSVAGIASVGAAITMYGSTGIISATAFYGDGSNLLNTGATLSAATGTQRLVLTSLTSGTMVDAATDGDLTFDANHNLLSVPSINVSVGATFGGTISAGGTTGTDGQYLQSTGVGVTWTSFPTLRTTQANIATDGQTSFNFAYNINFIDVFINGIKLTSSEYVANNGSTVVLESPAFGGDIVEFHSYNTTSFGGGGGSGGGATILNDLTDVTLSTLSAGQVLKYDGTKWINDTDSVGSVGAGGTWATDTVGINTTKNVGIGTTAKDGYKLYVEGDARVTGILTVGPASVTIDGINNEVTVGTGITLYGNTGIISATSLNVIGALSGDGSSLTGLTGASAATYGNGTAVPQITVDANGRITGITNVLISGGGGGGSSVIIQDSQSLVGAAGTIDFGTGLSVSPVSVGIVTVGINTAIINADTLNVSGVSTFNGDVHFNTTVADSGIFFDQDGASLTFKDDHTLVFGTSAIDGMIYSGTYNSVTGVHFRGTSTTTDLYRWGNFIVGPRLTSGHRLAIFKEKGTDGVGTDGGVELYYQDGSSPYNTAKRFETIGAGVTVTGTTFTNQLSVSGIVTTSNRFEIDYGNKKLQFGGSLSDSGNAQINLDNQTNGDLQFAASGSSDASRGNFIFYKKTSFGNKTAIATLYSDTGNLNVGGNVTASSFSGNGSGLTGITTTTAEWTLGANGTSDYTFTGPGVAAGALDPTIYLTRGQTYKFKNRTGSHPFRIQYEFQNTGGTAYTDGIVISDGSSASSGAGNNADLYWEVRNDAPDLLHYQCTSHTNMSGRIVILGDVVTNGSWTASAGTPQTIDTITGVANNDIKTAEYTVHIENGSNMQAQKVLVMQDGTTAYSQEYAIMHKSGLLVSMSATISGGNLLLQATPETGVSGTTTYKITRQTMR